MRRLLLLLAVLVLTGASAPAKSSGDDCTWGASSVVVDENGVQSEPVTTGCIPG